MDAQAMLKTFVVALLALAMSVEVAHAKDLLPRSAERMKPPFHEMSERQKREVADELMMQPSAFGVLFIAASLLLVVFLCSPFADLLVGGHARYRSERSNLYHRMGTLPKVLISRADYQIAGGVALRLRTQVVCPATI